MFWLELKAKIEVISTIIGWIIVAIFVLFLIIAMIISYFRERKLK